MDFLVRKFSEWLEMSGIGHELTRVKGGYIIHFIEPDLELQNLISSLYITIDTGRTVNHMAVKTPVQIFTGSGDIVMEDRYIGDILSTIQPILHEYAVKKLNNTVIGGH